MRYVILLSSILISSLSFAQEYRSISPGGGKVRYEIRLGQNPVQIPVEKSITQMFYSDSLLIFTTDNYMPWDCKWTIVDMKGHTFVSDKIPFWNSRVADLNPDFCNKRAIAFDYSIIDPSYRLIAKPKDGLEKMSTSFVDGIASTCIAIKDRNGNRKAFKTEYIDTDGKTVYPHLSCNPSNPWIFPVRKLRDGLRAHFDVTKQLWGYINSEGTVVIQPQYVEVHDFREGCAAVKCADGKWGFIDTSNTMVISPGFSIEPGDFHCGMAVVVRQNGQRTLLYRDGRIFQKDFSKVSPAIKNFCLAELYDHGPLLLIHKEKGILGQLPGFRYEVYAETEYRNPFFLFIDGVYSYNMIPICKTPGSRYLGNGLFWKNSNLNGYAAIVYDETGECKVVFPYKVNNSF